MLYTEPRCAEKRTTVLVAVKSRSLRDALQAVLTLVPRIGTISQTCDVSSTLKTVIDLDPALVLLDAGLLGDGVFSLVRTIKAGGPDSRCLVLADSVLQQEEARLQDLIAI